MQKKQVLALLIFLSFSLFLLAYFQPSITGFFGLGGGGADKDAVATGAKTPKSGSDGSGISPRISFQVVRDTVLEVGGSARTLPNCPQTAKVFFAVKNSGSEPAERLFVEATPNVEIKSCKNCGVKTIAPRQSVELELELCAKDSRRRGVSFRSLNSEAADYFFVGGG